MTGQAKSAKTQIADYLFLYNTVKQIIDDNLNIRLKVFYFSLEISKEEKMLSCFANILYIKEGIRISPVELKSTRVNSPLESHILDILDKYKPYFDKIEEIVEFIDSVRHGFGMYNLVRDYALSNGVLHKRKIDIDGVITEVIDYYEPNDPDEYVMIIVDHIGLISPAKRNGQQLTLHESISELSSDYLIKLRNRFNYIPVVVQQQALSGEGIEHRKAGLLKPSISNLGDNKLTSRDCNIAFGIFSPFRYEISDYLGYDITNFRDNIRFLEVLISRDGGGGTICPLYFDGAVNFFKELPLPNNTQGMEKVNELLKYIRKK